MNYIVFDLESTCGPEIPNGESEIIEIGAVKLNEKLEIIDEFQAFVRPVLHPTITYFCEELTSIKQADVDTAGTFNEVAVDFNYWCNDYGKSEYYLCSWGFYDKKMLVADSKRWGLKYGWVDRNHISIKHQHGEMLYKDEVQRLEVSGMISTTRTKQLKKGVGMAKALEMCNLKLDGTHHRGIDDARNIAKVFVKIFPNLKFDSK